jgi:uncharacterized membrane protein (UPF0127 family)
MVGLLGRRALEPDQAMLLDPCGSIHTVGMRFALDLIFIDRDGIIIKLAENIRPNRFLLGGWGAHAAIEMQAGAFNLNRLAVGQQTALAG